MHHLNTSISVCQKWAWCELIPPPTSPWSIRKQHLQSWYVNCPDEVFKIILQSSRKYALSWGHQILCGSAHTIILRWIAILLPRPLTGINPISSQRKKNVTCRINMNLITSHNFEERPKPFNRWFFFLHISSSFCRKY